HVLRTIRSIKIRDRLLAQICSSSFAYPLLNSEHSGPIVLTSGGYMKFRRSCGRFNLASSLQYSTGFRRRIILGACLALGITGFAASLAAEPPNFGGGGVYR